MTVFQERFLEELGAFQKAPFLFIGSGVSRRYINAENWEDLLKKFCDVLGENYNQLKAGANGVLPSVASELADRMFDRWWKEEQFAKHRTKYEGPNLKRESCLKIEISEYLQSISDFETDDNILKQELAALSKVVVDGVITTNYDTLLEKIFCEFKSYIGQNDLLFSDPQGVGEIYKIHGCCTNPDSLVLTREDYAHFNKRNPYLAAKLLTIFTEHPVIFMGYSVNDENIRSIIESIVSCLDEEGLDKLSNRLIMVQWRPALSEVVVSNHSLSFGGKAVPYKKIECPNFLELFEVLGSLKRRLSPKLLRHLRECVYDLVKTTDPITTVYVRDIDGDTDLAATEVVIGIGAVSTFMKGEAVEREEIAHRGYQTYTQTELIREYVCNDKSVITVRHCQSLVAGTLPTLLKTATHVPIFKHLSIGGYLDLEGDLVDDATVDERVIDTFALLSRLYSEKPSHYISKNDLLILPKNKKDFSTWIAEENNLKIINGLLYIKKSIIILDSLKVFLEENIDLLDARKTNHKTFYIKAVCLYDFFKIS